MSAPQQIRSRRAASRWTIVAALALASCSSSGDSITEVESTTSETATSQTAAPATTEPAADGLVTSLDDVESATIRIETTGSYVEPGDSLADASEHTGVFTGSGFIVDPAGIAVTNNHVVAGAATIEAFVGGADAPVTARVLGVSECSDLAVIDLEGDGYSYLGWYEGEITAGLEIRVAGYPQGDPEFTLTSGIVSKARADGEMPWASVDEAIEHDAATQPGSSGGPLMTVDARIVAVHYAHVQWADSSTEQYSAISAALAAPLVEQLAAGADVEALGVNGTAFVDDETGTSGIWVSSVETGSSAAEVGVLAGDVIERLEGLPMGVDGTMMHYCNVLQSHSPDDELTIQVFRPSDGVRLRGVVNGDALEPIESVLDQVDDIDVDAEGDSGETVPPYTDYITIFDDSGALQVQVPTDWDDVDGSYPFVDDDGAAYGLGLAAAPDLDGFASSWSVPGMGFSADPEGGDVAGLLDLNVELFGLADACSTDGSVDYDDGFYSGRAQVFSDCGGTDTDFVLIAATPPTATYNVLVQVQVVTDADLDALDHIIQTFVVTDPDALAAEDGGLDETGAYSTYRLVTDSSGTIQVEVPDAWVDVWSGKGFSDAEDPEDESRWHGVGLVVAPDVVDWAEHWGVSGVTISATSDFDPADLESWLDQRGTGDCTPQAVEPYSDPQYTGIIRSSVGCGSSDTEFVQIVATPADDAFLVYVGVTLATDADDAALERIIDTFLVIGDVPD